MEPTRNINVFLVEDNLLYRRALKEHLEENIQNIEVRTFNNGEEMLPLINQNPDVIVLDYMLQSSAQKAKNGMSILKKVVFKKPYTPVIILSEQKNKSLVTQLVDEGAYDYVAKYANGFERVTNDIRHIELELDDKRKEERSVMNALLWTLSFVAFLLICFYEINRH